MASTEQPMSRNGRHTSEVAEGPEIADVAGTEAPPAAEAIVAGTEAPPAAEAIVPAAELLPGFLSELAGAMQAVAGRERERLAARVADDAATHIDAVRSDGAVEAESFRRIADEDVARIDEWAEREIERIRAEAANRGIERRADLDATLRQHEEVMGAEIENIESAVVAYDARLERFVADLAAADDPERIARMAGSLPRPPDLTDIRATARAAALASIAERSIAGAATTAQGEAAALAADVAAADVAAAADVGGTSEPIPVVVDGSAVDGSLTDAGAMASVASVGVGDEPLGGLGDLIGETTNASTTDVLEPDGGHAPVAVMAPPDASIDGSVAGEGPASVGPTAPFGHTNAAVRLIRSVAPWTAPHASSTDDRPDPR